MKKIIIVLSSFLLYSYNLKAQDNNRDINKFSHAIYLDVYPPYSIASINYEFGYKYKRETMSKINMRIGGGSSRDDILLFAGSNIALGKRRSFFEMGFNRMFDLNSDYYNVSLTALVAGFRYQSYKGLYFHCLPTLLIYDKPQPNWGGKTSFGGWVSVGLGIAF